MTRFRWEGFGDLREELSRLQRELQRTLHRGGTNGAEELPAGGFPPLNVWEDHDQVYVEAELPGCEEADLEILVHGRRLTIQGKRTAPQLDKGVWHRQERGFGSFSRSVDLPTLVDSEQVDAELRGGVLLVRLTKHSEVRPKRILVKQA